MRTDRHDEDDSRFRDSVNVLKTTECTGEKCVSFVKLF
jgi:hypothetical protein